MFSTIIGEIGSLIHMILSIKNNKNNILKRLRIGNEDNKIIGKKIISIYMLNTSTKLIGSIIYFFEPIIYTQLMLKANISNHDLTLQYGVVNSYVLPLLLLPTFFSNCVSLFMLPKLSKYVENRNYKKVYTGKVIGENRVLVNI